MPQFHSHVLFGRTDLLCMLLGTPAAFTLYVRSGDCNANVKLTPVSVKLEWIRLTFSLGFRLLGELNAMIKFQVAIPAHDLYMVGEVVSPRTTEAER